MPRVRRGVVDEPVRRDHALRRGRAAPAVDEHGPAPDQAVGVTDWLVLVMAWGAMALLGLAVIVGVTISGWARRRSDGRLTDERLRAGPADAVPTPRDQPAGGQSRRTAPPLPPPPEPPPPFEPPPTPAGQATPVRPVGNAELRQWARTSGLHIADRGPIPRHVREAWAQAHQ
ncbi:Lsr2 family protein [Blastococcus litoris]|uniref:Lsr2 family DNA-binding protein n=1 Tax=Blastococcus litoris TaxID=2171622 RepID=UPI000E3051DB